MANPRVSYLSNKIFIYAGSAVAVGIAAFFYFQENETYLDQDINNLSFDQPPVNFIPQFSIGAAADDFVKLRSLAGSATVDAAQALMSQLREAIFKELPCYFSYKVLLWLMRREKPLSISMVPPLVMDNEEANRDGTYFPGELKKYNNNIPNIQLKAQPNLLNQKSTNKKFILRNEFFHAICDQANRMKTQSLEKRFLPFLDKEGNVVEALFNQFSLSVHKAGERIKRLQNLLKKKYLLTNENLELTNAQHILRSYQPYVFLMILTNKEYENLIKHSRIEIKSGKKLLLKGTKIKKLTLNENYIIKDIVNHSDMVEIFYTYQGKTKADLFTKDFLQLTASLSQNSRYSKLKKEMWYAEAASTLEMFDPGIKQFFAPEFCQYMGEYTGIGVDAYCAIPVNKQCPNLSILE